MEKICIVQRRKRQLPADGMSAGTITSAGIVSTPEQKVHTMSAYMVDNQCTFPGAVNLSTGSLTEERCDVVSLRLTSEQCERILSSDFEQYLADNVSCEMKLKAERGEDGRITMHFHFDTAPEHRMLKPEEVCEMLQISKSFLGKIVRKNQLKSYKLGRLRRFSLVDILEYLAQNEEVKRIWGEMVCGA